MNKKNECNWVTLHYPWERDPLKLNISKKILPQIPPIVNPLPNFQLNELEDYCIGFGKSHILPYKINFKKTKIISHDSDKETSTNLSIYLNFSRGLDTPLYSKKDTDFMKKATRESVEKESGINIKLNNETS